MTDIQFDYSMLTPREREERRAFLERRQGGIGGSDMAPILGLAPKINGRQKNALDVYHEKTRPITDESLGDESIHQWRGRTDERRAFREYLKRSGRDGRLQGGPVSHPDYPNVVVSPDGVTFADDSRPDPYKGTGTVEVKNPMSWVFGNVIDNGLRYSEIIQLNTEIAAAQHDWGTITYYNTEHKRGPSIWVDQPADPFLGKFLLEHGQRFWDEHVVPRIPPDPHEWAKLLDDPEAPEIVDLSGEVAVVRDEDYRELLREELDTKDLKKEAEEAYESVKARLHKATLALGHKKLQVPAVGKATVVTLKGRAGFNYQQVIEHRPIDRDRLLHWLEEQGVEITLEELFGLELNMDVYRTVGAPSQYTRTTRGKDVE